MSTEDHWIGAGEVRRTAPEMTLLVDNYLLRRKLVNCKVGLLIAAALGFGFGMLFQMFLAS